MKTSGQRCYEGRCDTGDACDKTIPDQLQMFESNGLRIEHRIFTPTIIDGGVTRHAPAKR